LHLSIARQALGTKKTNAAESLHALREEAEELIARNMIVRNIPVALPKKCRGSDEKARRIEEIHCSKVGRGPELPVFQSWVCLADR
jgi:hypothetical protein